MTAQVPAPHHAADGRFRNPWPGERERGFGDMLRWMLERARHGRLGLRGRGNPPTATSPELCTPRAPPNEFRATWIGHSTFLLQIGGRNVLTDPMFGDRASPLSWAGPRRLVRPGMPLDALPPIDIVLLSHDHFDHLDNASIRTLARRWPDAVWCAPLGLAPALHVLGVRTIVERDWHESVEPVAGARVICVPARHFSGRSLASRNSTLWCGWTLEVARHRAYVVGDSGHHPDFGEIGRRYGPFDAVLMPVGAYDPRWFMRPVHMDPEEAVDAFDAVRQAHPSHRVVMLTMHWGTFVLSDEPVDEPPRRARAAWAARRLPVDDLWVLLPGETRVVRRSDARPG